jgi:glutamate dehydrogenase/leucine dehydrogenase
MLTDPLSAAIVTGNPSGTEVVAWAVVAVAPAVVTVAGGVVVSAVGVAQAAANTSITAIDAVFLMDTSSDLEDEEVGGFP